ncbi:MAG: RNA methyltransferase [Sphingomonadales bacterium]|nr:RNA methyltransferase [Sphingomonadales bacterium]
MPSTAEIKQYSALRMPKYRQKYGQFMVEGRKNVLEVFHSDWKIVRILATLQGIEGLKLPFEPEIVSRQDYAKISQMDTPPGLCAIVEIREWKSSQIDFNQPVVLALDGISDPGNLGTILRTADWFGFRQVVLSKDCTDVHNAKCISATMGSFTRMQWVYGDLTEILENKNVLGCFMDGENVGAISPDFPAVLLIGSEAHGIRSKAEKAVKKRISIPGAGLTESLNAGVAAGIVMHALFSQIKLV